ncbi:hypothetical protein JG688_00011194 [Phytophthora aleatoria]|uniref:HTH psq-type domain-containing protein n=1 Tax=Phytophthora aleatoria TaxID=2496075 RepID=A0A8J5J4A2_9STRA|nr:hypothetical protein JG688_00011194 [Phytophthora aleatoria]
MLFCSIITSKLFPTRCKPQSTNEERRQAVLEVRVAGEVTEGLAAKYDVHRATLWRWAKAEARINEGQGTKRKKKVMSTVKRGVKLRFPLLEARLLEWFTDLRKNKAMCVTSQCLLLMAVRFELEYLTGRSLDAAVEVADKCSRTITYNLEMVGLFAGVQVAGKYESVFSMEQTSIYIDMGPKRTIEFVGAKNVDTIQGMSENSFRASVFLCASATGSRFPCSMCSYYGDCCKGMESGSNEGNCARLHQGGHRTLRTAGC